MNKKLLFALILASSVTCQASTKPMPTEVLTPENVPAVPQALLQPIAISDQKSATGKAELTAYVLQLEKVDEKLELVMKKQDTLLNELDSALTVEKKQQLRSEIMAEREKVWAGVQEEINTLSKLATNTQDKEVKAIIEYGVLHLSVKVEAWQKMVNRTIDEALVSVEKDLKLKDAISTFEEKMSSTLNILETATDKLAEKYQVDLPE